LLLSKASPCFQYPIFAGSKKVAHLKLKNIFPMEKNKVPAEKQPNNPMHAVKLVTVLEVLVEQYGWETLGSMLNINCFKNGPSFKSSLKFLRKTQWARDKVERLYLQNQK
jgi:uncharacterized protein (DUF2132 family)